MVRSNSAPTHHAPVPTLTPDVQHRFNARVLDPQVVLHTPHDVPTQATAYVANSLIIHGTTDQVSMEALRTLRVAAQEEQIAIHVDDSGPKTRQLFADVSPAAAQVIDQHWPTKVSLRRRSKLPMPSVDAWELMQHTRLLGAAHNLNLEHIVHAVPSSVHEPLRPSGAVGDAQQINSFAKIPVQVVGADPALHAPSVHRTPNVVVLDTEIGEHPWFTDPEQVQRSATVMGIDLGIDGRFGPPPATTVDVTGTLSPAAGHGTFIAGLIRQTCPQARVIGIPTFDDDGVVNEHSLLTSLVLLLARHIVASERNEETGIVDVLTLSLGYYHEQPKDRAHTSSLARIVGAMAEHGITVVASAGSDTTLAPIMPAAVSAEVTAAGHAPMVSVGSLNPGGKSVSWFSNAGQWVTCHREGANLISTIDVPGFPADQPRSQRSGSPSNAPAGGFALWTGTSFAAPVFAGQVAALMANGPVAVDRASLIKRAHEAVQENLSEGTAG